MSDIDDLLRMVGLRNRAERPYYPLANSSSEDDAVGTANDTTQESRNAVEELFNDPALPEDLEHVASLLITITLRNCHKMTQIC